MTTSDVHIDRCVLRIRRANGWSWGPDPDALIRAASKSLPALIGRHLESVAMSSSTTETSDVTIERVRLAIPVTLAELAMLPGLAHASDNAIAGSKLEARIEDALRLALRDAALEIDDAASNVEENAHRAEQARVDGVGDPRAEIARILMAWASARQHVHAIHRLSVEVAQAWRSTLVGHVANVRVAHDRHARDQATAPSEAVATFARTAPTYTHAWLAVFAERLPEQLDRGAIDAAVASADTYFATTAREDARASSHAAHSPVDMREADAAAETSTLSSSVGVAGAVVAQTSSSSAVADVEIACALPFLALVPLARIGWLATLEAAVRAARLDDILPSLASALAYKLLPPAARGWHRSQTAQDAAAAFAGQVHATTEPVVSRMRALEQHVAEPLLSTARSVMARGHTAGSPLVAHVDAMGGYHLFEVDGLFPYEWSAPARCVALACNDVVLVPAATAKPELLDALDLGNRTFVTDAPRARAETWRELPGGLRTNDTSTAADRLIAQARKMADAELLARELDAVMSERPAIPGHASSLVEHCLSQAAVLALADLAWTLFREREAPTPVLALRRFADLSARVTFGTDVVRVRIPLGRRHADLFAHRYTGEVRGVPWLEGRTLEICGG